MMARAPIHGGILVLFINSRSPEASAIVQTLKTRELSTGWSFGAGCCPADSVCAIEVPSFKHEASSH